MLQQSSYLKVLEVLVDGKCNESIVRESRTLLCEGKAVSPTRRKLGYCFVLMVLQTLEATFKPTRCMRRMRTKTLPPPVMGDTSPEPEKNFGRNLQVSEK